MHFISPLFYLLFVASTYLLSKQLLSNGAAILATAASTVLITLYYIEVAPFGLAYIVFPLVFYLYFKFTKEKSISFAILLISLIILMVPFHPANSFMLTLALVIMELSKILFKKLYIGKRENAHSSLPLSQQISWNLPLISFIVLMLWLWNHYGLWEYTVLGVYDWLRGELLTRPLTTLAAESFNRLGLGTLDIVGLFIRMYGHIFIYFVLSLIGILMIMRKRVSSIGDIRGTFLFSIFFLTAVVLWLIDYASPLTVLSSGRITFLVVALFPPLVGLTLYQIGRMERKGEGVTKKSLSQLHKGKLGRGIAIGAIITICSLIGIFSIYHSPLIHQPNTQVTHREIAGGKWLLERGNPDVEVTGASIAKPYRYAHALWGTQEKNYPRAGEDYFVGDHFNYSQYQTLGESLEGDRYMMLRSEFIKLLYSELYPQVGRFNMDDFSKLERDPSVNRLYANGEIDIFYVQGEARAE